MFEDIKNYKIVRDTLKKEYENNIKLQMEKEKELSDCLEEINLLKLSYEQLEKIISDSNKHYINRIKSILNKAISTIFYDEDYYINIIVEDKKLNFMLVDNNNTDDKGTPLEVDLNDACGGGIITVIGFILQLFTIEMLQVNKIIFIDEGFMALSESYRPLFYDFINEFCESTGMIVLLVSHDELVKEKAKQIFEIEHGNIKEEK